MVYRADARESPGYCLEGARPCEREKRGQERARQGRMGCSLDCSIDEHKRGRSAQLKVRAQRGIVVLYSFSKGCGRAVDGCSDSEALPCCLPCLVCLACPVLSCPACHHPVLSCLPCLGSCLASPFAHRTAPQPDIRYCCICITVAKNRST